MTENQKFDVSGMSCAACSAHVTKAVSGVNGVKEVNVNLLTNSMLVTYDSPASPKAISDAVEKAGYGAKLAAGQDGENKAHGPSIEEEKDQLADHETPKLLKRLIVSLVLLVPLFYLSMGYMNPSWNWPLGVFADHPFCFGLIEMVISLMIMIVNKKFFVSGFKSAIHGAPNMDTLVALGSGVGFVYGVVVMFMMADKVAPNMDAASYESIMMLSMGLTFETAGMVPTLITIGKTLESYSKGKTTNAIKSLLDLAPKTAHVVRNGAEETIPAEEVVLGDTFIVRPGESFPVDGIVLEGESAVNEAALTGESLPVDKAKGDKVSAATINQNGALTCQATRVGGDTTLHQIINMVQTAAGTKTKISQLADKVSAVFVPTILGISLVVFVVWLILGLTINAYPEGSSAIAYSVARAISVLVIACPCALGLATPVAIMVGSGKGAKNGILFKTASSLEETGKVDFVVLDKTGTLTKGAPVVTDILPVHGVKAPELLALAASLEGNSEHPLAKAIREKARQDNVNLQEVASFRALPGHGVSGLIDGVEAYGSNAAWMKDKGLMTVEMRKCGEDFADEGKTPLYFARGEKLLGIIAVADVLKDDSKQAIDEFIKMGVTPIMLTGDNKRTAKAIATQLGLTYFISDVLPEGKLDVIKKLQTLGKVAMVGDGINDAPALTQADIGLAIGAGSDVAIDSADVVLMKSSLADAAAAIKLSRHTLTNIKENLFWAFFYNVLMIPLAAGVFYATGNEYLAKMQPWYGAAAMAFSSVFVCLNALRINLYNVYNENRDYRHKKVEIPENFFGSDAKEWLELSIEGMMCEKCVVHVTKALTGVAGVDEVKVSLEENNALVAGSADVDSLSKAVETAGYKVTASAKKLVAEEEKTIEKGNTMTKTLEIKGMMCGHCAMHVKNALAGVNGVSNVNVSLENKNAVIEVSESVSDEELSAAVKEAGYEVTSIR